MCTANVRITSIATALRMPSDSISEHVILKFFLGVYPQPPNNNILHMLAVLITASDLSDQCCVAKPVPPYMHNDPPKL